jgi:hypothetical protein
VADFNQVFFSDPSRPSWRLFVARTKDGTAHVSVVAVRLAGGKPAAPDGDLYSGAPTLLPAESAGREGIDRARPGPAQIQTTSPECEAYQAKQRERAAKEEELRRLGFELNDLQMRWQAALNKAAENERLQSANAANAQTGKGPLGALSAAGSVGAGLAAQQSRAEAQNLQTEIRLKQTQITMARAALPALSSSSPPFGCGDSRASQVPLQPAATLPASDTAVRAEVEKIRSGKYAPMPSSERTAGAAPLVAGPTTMNVKNLTDYDLSVFFDGPISARLTIKPKESRDLELVPGTFRVAGRVDAGDVLPFYGEETYARSARYSLTFYIAQ